MNDSFFRARRLRDHAVTRGWTRETRLHPEQFLYPVFIVEGRNIEDPIAAMPGVHHYSVDRLLCHLATLIPLGVRALLLFGLPARKDSLGGEAFSARGVVQRAVRAVRKEFPDLYLVTDVCLCQYTDHGHCGLPGKRGRIDNDSTLKVLAKVALSHAHAGADMVAPSDMMDGRVAAIRSALDRDGLRELPILSYSAKYASGFYGPFREAAHSAPQFGDRRGYQMDPANTNEALREMRADLNEGADMLMVKPALAYLDILSRAKKELNVPLAAYNVSGEYSMVKAAAARGWVDEKRVVLEVLTGIARAGADLIISYHTPDVLRWLREENT